MSTNPSTTIKPADPGAGARRLGIGATLIGVLPILLGTIATFSGGTPQSASFLLLGLALTVPGLLAQILAQLMNAAAK